MIEIHNDWKDRPENLRHIIITLAALERLPAVAEEASDPESLPRTRPNGRHPGNDDMGGECRVAGGGIGSGRTDPLPPPATHHPPLEEDPPADGRQLLGWAAKQLPDAKGRVIGYGKKRGFPSRILDWTPQQVAMAYHAARALTARA